MLDPEPRIDLSGITRRASIGFGFQSFNLIDDLSVEENVDVALLYRGLPASEQRRRVADLLSMANCPSRDCRQLIQPAFI